MRKYSCIAALAGLLFGYDTGIISDSIVFIQMWFHLSTIMTEIVVAVVLLGAMTGAIFSAKIVNVIGRRTILEIDAIVFTVTTLVSALAPNVWVFILGRLGVGFAIGLACYVVPLYISELAPAKMRGALVAKNTMAVTGGIFFSYIIGYLLSPLESWRLMLVLGVVPAIILWIAVRRLPESPRWLVKSGRIEEARKLLYETRDSLKEADEEVRGIEESLRETSSSWRELLAPGLRKVLWIGVVLAAVQQVTGINTILYYAPLLFRSFGFESVSSLMLLTLAVGLINFLMTVFVMLRVDHLGRRVLLLWGLLFMAISHLILALSLQGSSSLAIWVTIISLVTFVAAYAGSIGSIFWIVIAEIYPLHVRGLAMGLASSVNWAINLLITVTFLSLIEVLGTSHTFFGYGILCLLSYGFCYYYLPETAQRSLEEIEANVYSKD